jgi:hypothetical protein
MFSLTIIDIEIGNFTKNMNAIEEVNEPLLEDGRVNFQRFVMLMWQIRNLQTYQQSNYNNIDVHLKFYEFLQNGLKDRSMCDDELFRLSREREPRNMDDSGGGGIGIGSGSGGGGDGGSPSGITGLSLRAVLESSSSSVSGDSPPPSPISPGSSASESALGDTDLSKRPSLGSNPSASDSGLSTRHRRNKSVDNDSKRNNRRKDKGKERDNGDGKDREGMDEVRRVVNPIFGAKLPSPRRPRPQPSPRQGMRGQ